MNKCPECKSIKYSKDIVSDSIQHIKCKDCGFIYALPKNPNFLTPKSDITGLRFGRLFILEWVGGYYWNSLCDCGNKKTVDKYSLRGNSLKSCGCYTSERAIGNWKAQAIKNRKDFGYAGSKKTYSTRKRGAKSRGIYFDITFEQFLKISSQNCYYCNIEPKQCCKYENTFGDYYYNGMDRVESSKGYTIDNVVTCCWNCNKAKSSLSQIDFLNLVENIYNNRIKNKK